MSAEILFATNVFYIYFICELKAKLTVLLVFYVSRDRLKYTPYGLIGKGIVTAEW